VEEFWLLFAEGLNASRNLQRRGWEGEFFFFFKNQLNSDCPGGNQYVRLFMVKRTSFLDIENADEFLI
jgi:hypothetical protein